MILRFFYVFLHLLLTLNPNGIKILLANDLISFFMNGNPVFSNGPRLLPRNPPDCIIQLIKWFAKALQGFQNLSVS